MRTFRSLLGVTLCVVWAGCVEDPHTALVSTVIEPPGVNCAAGGQAVQVGTDDDDDGQLDPNEVTSTAYVCVPAEAPHPLVATVPEAPGVNCGLGGQAIQFGFDQDRDGVLSTSEVVSVSYVCSAPVGTSLVEVITEPAGMNCPYGGQAIRVGADTDGDGVFDPLELVSVSFVCVPAGGTQALLRVVSEPPGAHCSAGGSSIQAGIDLDVDGVLDDLEVQSTTYVCRTALAPTVIYGDVVIHNSAEVAELDGVVEITGNVTLDYISAPFPFVLPTLQRVGGIVGSNYCLFEGQMGLPALISAQALTLCAPTLDVPNLRRANVSLRSYGNDPSELSFPSLEEGEISIEGYNITKISAPALVTGALRVTINPGASFPLAEVSLPNLTNQSGTFGVSIDRSEITSLALPNFASGYVLVLGSPQLALLSLPVLATGGVGLTGLTALQVLNLPALTSGYLHIDDSDQLTSISAPLMASANGVQIMRNAVLTSVDMPALAGISGMFRISDNPTFPTCRAQLLAVQANATNPTISGNDDTATCP